MMGTVVKLDRGFPLVKCDDGSLVRCEHATALVKERRSRGMRAVIGDRVQVSLPAGHDKGIIEHIEPRRTAFVRKDPAARTESQVLAANFELVIVAEPAGMLNAGRLERELVLAHQTGARVAVALTKADLAGEDDVGSALRLARALAGRDVDVLTLSADDAASVESVRALIAPGTTAVLVGKSGVGKSTLVNLLAGVEVQETASVREGDGKGRHTTVDRVLVELPNGGFVVDMPGVRGLGLWDADAGLEAAFSDVDELASQCRFRDCRHIDEPGCAVLSAVDAGALAPERAESYRKLTAEVEAVRVRREEARHKRGEKASDRKDAGAGRAGGKRTGASEGRDRGGANTGAGRAGGKRPGGTGGRSKRRR